MGKETNNKKFGKGKDMANLDERTNLGLRAAHWIPSKECH